MKTSNDNFVKEERSVSQTSKGEHVSAFQSTDSSICFNENNNNNININNNNRNKISAASTVSGGSFRDGSFLTRSGVAPELETYFMERQMGVLSKDNDKEPLLKRSEDNDNYIEDSYIEYSESECSLIDPQECEYQRGSGWPSGILIMANVCLGMGILNFPRIFYEAGGILPTFISLGIFVILIAGSLYIIAYCCRYYACVNYQDMVRVHCGKHLGAVCSIALFLELSGSLIVKMVVLADQLDRLYSIIAGHEEIQKHYYLMPIVALIIYLPMCFIKDFSCFKYVSVGGVLAALYITFGVAVVGYYISPAIGPDKFIENKMEIRDFNLLIPLLVYGYHGHVEAPLVFSGLKKQKLHNFMKTVYSYLFISTLCYSICGLFGYLTFGRDTNVDFLLNYPNGNWYANAAILIVSFKLFTSFPVLFFVIRTVFNGFYLKITGVIPNTKVKDTLENYTFARIFQTLLIFFFIIIFAAVIPNISNAISLIGAVSCHFCFTFPGLCFFCLYYNAPFSNRKHFIRKAGGIFYIILGMFCFGVNFTVAIQKFISGKPGH